MTSREFQRCLFCDKMRRLGVEKHNHKRCLRSETLQCDCGCWQTFIENSIKAQDQDEHIKMYHQTKSGMSTQGAKTIGGRVLPSHEDA